MKKKTKKFFEDFALPMLTQSAFSQLTQMASNPLKQFRGEFIDKNKMRHTHEQFLLRTNDAKTTLDQMLGHHKPGLHIALLSPSGKTLKTWSDEEVSGSEVAAEYVRSQKHYREIPDCEWQGARIGLYAATIKCLEGKSIDVATLRIKLLQIAQAFH